MIYHLVQTVVTRNLHFGLASALAALITDRTRIIADRFERLAQRIASGKFVPRPPQGTPTPAQTPPKPSARKGRKPGSRNVLPGRPAWLFKDIHPAANDAAAWLRHWFADPEVVAILAAAPEESRRILRPLRRMLGVEWPPVLALPPRPPRPKAPRKPRPKRKPFIEITFPPQPPGSPQFLLGEYRPSANWNSLKAWKNHR